MAWLPFAKLEITDGTTTINLLNNQSAGFLITDWQPAIQDLKAGGTWADAPTADERELIVAQLADSEDQFTFDVSAASPDELIGFLRSLRAMLQKAREYTTTTWQDVPVYIRAQGYGDTNARYTRVKNWRTPADGFPYGPPMWDTIQGNAIEDFQIIIEHGAWLENAPGTGTATEISAVETYDGVNFGNVDSTGTRDPTTANEVYIANKRNVANLTHVYFDNGGVWSGNIIGIPKPVAFLPAVPAVADAVYFGIDTTVADSGPFCSLVFDLSVAGAGYTGIWEYWAGAWIAPPLGLQDNTNQDGAMTGIAFDTTGVNSVVFWTGDTFTTRNLAADGGPAVTGYFIRYRVTATPGALTAPVQQNRDIYSVVWPYVEIQEDAATGDMPPITAIKIIQEGDGSLNPAGAPDLFGNRYVCGLRKYDRGSLFSAYLNAADEQNPAGITCTAPSATAAFANFASSPTGRVILYNPAGVETMSDVALWTLDDTISPHYYGAFHVYLVGSRNNVPGPGTSLPYIQVRLRVRSGVGNIEYYSETKQFTESAAGVGSVLLNSVVDFGQVKIPSANISASETVGQIEIAVQAENTSAATLTDLYIVEVVLIPIDEFAFDSDDAQNDVDSRVDHGRYLFVDSVNYPKISNRSLVRDVSSDDIISVYSLIANGESIIQANARQRLWFFAMSHESFGDAALRANYALLHSVLIERNQRYWSMRGTG